MITLHSFSLFFSLETPWVSLGYRLPIVQTKCAREVFLPVLFFYFFLSSTTSDFHISIQIPRAGENEEKNA